MIPCSGVSTVTGRGRYKTIASTSFLRTHGHGKLQRRCPFVAPAKSLPRRRPWAGAQGHKLARNWRLSCPASETRSLFQVIPAEAGIQRSAGERWIPAYAGMTRRRHWIPAPYRIQGKLCAGMRTRPCEHLSGLHAPRVPARKDDTLLHDIECNAGKEGGGNLWFPGGGTGVSPVRLHSPS